ncbi:MAG: sodium/glutamate symporter [Pseudomonadota bacterium]
MPEQIQIDGYLSFTIGMIVFFVGKRINESIPLLKEYNIPDAVTGGICASIVGLLIFVVVGRELAFDLAPRDLLLIYFFTTIGLNARLSDLVSGGRPLLILLALTLGYILVQDSVGLLSARLLGLEDAMGVLIGSASLIGGHGTAISWAPEIAEYHGVENALEVGVASATLGLVMGSLLGGPIAKILIERHNLSSDESEADRVVGVGDDVADGTQVNYENFLRALLVIHIVIIVGYGLSLGIERTRLKLPMFVPCLLVAIVVTNTMSTFFPKTPWPARSKSLALIADLSLALFIAMSLMGMQLWSIADLAGPLIIMLALQAAVAVVFILFVLFAAMGRGYLAAVLSAGFAGFSLGSTPTAIANMTAVTKKHGPSPTAFIILPLVGAFFVDLSNAFVIQFFLSL